jgi:hypothetical protein
METKGNINVMCNTLSNLPVDLSNPVIYLYEPSRRAAYLYEHNRK